MRVLFTLLLFVSAISTFAQDGLPDIFFTTGGGTTWGDPASWTALSFIDDPCCGGDGIPDGDDLIFVNHPITVGSNQEYGTLEINHDGTHGTALMELTVSGGFTLTGIVGAETGNINIISSSSSIRIARLKVLGTVLASAVTATSAGLAGRAFVFVQNGGDLTINGDLTFASNTAANSSLTCVGSGNIVNLTGAIAGTGRVACGTTAATSSFNFTGSGAQTINTTSFSITYASIEISNATGVTTDADLNNTNVNGTFLVNTGAVFNQGTFVHTFDNDVTNDGAYNLNGDLIMNGGAGFSNTGTFISSGGNINLQGNWANTGTYTFTAGDVVTLDGTTAQSVTGTTSFDNLTLTNTTGGAADVSFPSGSSTVATLFDINDCSVDNTGASVVLLSTGSGTAQLADMGTGSYTGNLTVQRQVACTNQGFRELSSPVAGTVLDNWEDDGIIMSGFTNSDFPAFGFVSVYSYDEVAAGGVKNNGWTDAVDASTEATGSTSAHRVYMDATTFNMSVTGTPVQGDQSIPFTRTGGDDENDGWNFIGNPYPCTVNWDSLTGPDKAGLDEIYYVWNPTSGGYASHETAGVNLNGGSSLLAHSQGMWVHATAGGSLEWQETDKSTTDRAFVKSSNEVSTEVMTVKISSTMNSFYDEIALRTSKFGSNDFDAGVDFHKLGSVIEDDVAQICFLTDDGAHLAISSISESSNDVYLKAFAGVNAMGTYTLDFSNVDHFAKNACVTLVDLSNGVVTDLRSTPTYTYAVLPGDEASARFIIRVSVQYDVNEVDVSCFGMNDGMLDITHHEASVFDVTWSDASGTLLGSAASSSPNHTISGLSSGDYIVNVTGACSSEDYPITIGNTAEVLADFTTDAMIDVGVDLDITNGSTGATNYSWDLGDGTLSTDEVPVHSYATPGSYTITLNADNVNIGSCTDTKTFVVDVLNAASLNNIDAIKVSAYVSNDQLIITNENGLSLSNVQLLDIEGKLIVNRALNISSNTSIALPTMATGTYVIKITTEEGIRAIKIVI